MKEIFKTFNDFLNEIDRFEKVVGDRAGKVFCTMSRKTIGEWKTNEKTSQVEVIWK